MAVQFRWPVNTPATTAYADAPAWAPPRLEVIRYRTQKLGKHGAVPVIVYNGDIFFLVRQS